MPSTPQFVVSKGNFCYWHHNKWCPSRNFSSAPNNLTRAEIVGFWKTKSYLEDFYCSCIFLNSCIMIHLYRYTKKPNQTEKFPRQFSWNGFTRHCAALNCLWELYSFYVLIPNFAIGSTQPCFSITSNITESASHVWKLNISC